MDSDMKWVAMFLIAFIGIPLCGMSLSEYQQSQCRIEAIKAHMEPEAIVKVCK